MTPHGLLRLARALEEAAAWLDFAGHPIPALRAQDASGALEAVARREHQLVFAEEAERIEAAGGDPGWGWLYTYGALGRRPEELAEMLPIGALGPKGRPVPRRAGKSGR